MTVEKCRQCGDALVGKPDRGRPPRYCSVLCRRLHEYELRRLVRRLERADVDVEVYERELRASYVFNPKAVAERLAAALAFRDDCKRDLDEALARSERGSLAMTEGAEDG